MTDQQEQERFLSQVRKTETCWLWIGPGFGRGYGWAWSKAAHRMAYELFVGPILYGLQVNHHCDVRRCVNPAHLYVGTQSQNIRDAVVRGRHVPSRTSAKGEAHHLTRLTTEQVQAMRWRYGVGGITQVALAREYGVSEPTVRDILNRRTWAHVG